jgi:hypothetical protein
VTLSWRRDENSQIRKGFFGIQSILDAVEDGSNRERFE